MSVNYSPFKVYVRHSVKRVTTSHMHAILNNYPLKWRQIANTMQGLISQSGRDKKHYPLVWCIVMADITRALNQSKLWNCISLCTDSQVGYGAKIKTLGPRVSPNAPLGSPFSLIAFITPLQTAPFALHLRKINIHLCPNLFHYGHYTLINTNMTFICA